jgi:hypothetical protein
MKSKNIFNKTCIVVQGPVYGKQTEPYKKRFTQRCLESVRKYLPNAKIILSTWQGEDVSGLDFDVLVQSISIDDGVKFSKTAIFSLNKQLISTQAGLNACDREYVLKIRSDLILKSANFLKYFDKYNARVDDYRILKSRVLNCSLLSRVRLGDKKSFSTHCPFHPSDWIWFGLTEDIKNIFYIPLDKPSNATYFKRNDVERLSSDVCSDASHRFPPEQYFWLEFLKKNGYRFDLPHRIDDKRVFTNDSMMTVVNNLVILDQYQWSFEMPKYNFRQHKISFGEWSGLITFYKWKKYYNKFFLKRKFSLTLPTMDVLKRLVHNLQFIHRLR